MRKIILFVTCIFCFEFANAQGPIFEWASSFGGVTDNHGNSIVVDALGNVYTTGNFIGTVDFDPGVGTFNMTSTGTFDNIFISKLDATGNFVWAKSIGGVISAGISIAVDVSSNLYITGYFQGTADFDTGPGTINLTSGGGFDVFIAKLDSNGNYVWAKNTGGTDYVSGSSIAVDTFGNVYTVGSFEGAVDFDIGAGIFYLTTDSTNENMFVLKLDSLGNFVWAKNIGGVLGPNTRGNSIVVNKLGEVYTSGSFIGTVDLDPGVGTFDLTSDTSYYNIFILKLDVNGNFVWAKKIGATINWLVNEERSIVIDEFNNVYATGCFYGAADFDPNSGTYNLTSSASTADIFILKLDSFGGFVWAKSIGGTSNDFGISIAIDISNNVYTTGYFNGTVDFDSGAGIVNLNSTTSMDDVFILKIDESGNFIWAKNIGGTSYNRGYSIALNALGNVYTLGKFYGTTDFDLSTGIFNLTASSGGDIFVQKMSQPPTSINESANPNNISFYPNPHNGTFNISISSQIKNGSIEIYNSLGDLVFKQETINQENTIELSNQANGLYFVKVMSENKIVWMGKIVKQ